MECPLCFHLYNNGEAGLGRGRCMRFHLGSLVGGVLLGGGIGRITYSSTLILEVCTLWYGVVRCCYKRTPAKKKT
jgi:hypothetical protein